MIKTVVNMQYLLCLDMLTIVGIELEHYQFAFELRKYELKLEYLIVVIFYIKSRYRC